MSKVYELSCKIDELKDKIHQLCSDEWEAYYKNRCPKYYISFDKFVQTIFFENMFNKDNAHRRFEEKCYFGLHSEENANIPHIIGIAVNEFGFKIPKSLEPMICEACACQGCPDMEDHLGHTCEDCKKEQWQLYEGYCDE